MPLLMVKEILRVIKEKIEFNTKPILSPLLDVGDFLYFLGSNNCFFPILQSILKISLSVRLTLDFGLPQSHNLPE